MILLIALLLAHPAQAFDRDGASHCVDNCYTAELDNPDFSEDACFDRCGLDVNDYQDGELEY